MFKTSKITDVVSW